MLEKEKINPNLWVLVTTVYEIELTKSIKDEFDIEDIKLISKSKLLHERVRKRLKLPVPLNEIKSLDIDCPTYAVKVVKAQKGKSKEDLLADFKTQVIEISYILLATQARINDHGQKAIVNIHGSFMKPQSGFMAHNLSDLSKSSSYIEFPRPKNTFYLTSNVLYDSRKDGFLTSYLKLDASSMSSSMKKTIRNCIIFLGRSQNEIEPHISFLNNMIALDCLLVSSDAKHKITAQNHLKALFGWTDYWDEKLHKGWIDEIYSARSKMVHDGNVSSITIEHVKYTNFILRNLLYNICKYPDVFKDRNHLNSFVEKVKAERVLGIPSVRSKTFPKKFRFFSCNTLKPLKN